jgi:hypothetical protein
MPTVWVSDEASALNEHVLDDLKIAVLVRCIGKSKVHMKGSFRLVDASIFSETWGRGPYDSLVDVLAVVYNTMSQVSFASKHDPSQSRDHARLCIFHQWKYAPCLTSGGPQRPSGWNATRHT